MNSMSERAHSTASDHGVTDAQSTYPTDNRSEEIHIRNFDVERTYDLTVTVQDTDGIVFANRYHLKPGTTVSELDRLAAGEYVVQVALDGRQQAVTECTVDETPENTALIEVGNGIVSVTEGLYR
jgi:hypothetical protein